MTTAFVSAQGKEVAAEKNVKSLDDDMDSYFEKKPAAVVADDA